MKRTVLVVVLALVLTLAFTASAFATTGKFFANSQSYYTWYTTTLDNNNAVGGSAVPPVTAGRPAPLFNIGANPSNPGVHANYLANTAKCGICHSVHRAAGDGTKLLPTADATCYGCHVAGTTVSTKVITWTPYDTNWVPTISPTDPLAPIGSAAWLAASSSAKTAAITNKPAAGGAANGGGPHNDSALDLIADGIWNGTGTTPEASYELGHRYGCFTRRCHATNPHGADSSKYKLFAAKLLFNESAADDELGAGTYGGEDAVWDDLGATDASVERFVTQNASIVSTTAAGDILIHGLAPNAAETHALVAGLTCGRPSNPSTGEDECHAEASYAIVDKGITERRNHATNFTSPGGYRTDNTGAELTGWGGNDNRDVKTGHVAGSFAATTGAGSYVPISGCTSCHDQTDGANTVAGNFTFPHGQSAAGATNLYLPNGTFATTGGDVALTASVRSRIWSGWSGSMVATKTVTGSAPAGQKAYDGQCLKCHRDGAGAGIGLTH